jgi:G8 domain
MKVSVTATVFCLALAITATAASVRGSNRKSAASSATNSSSHEDQGVADLQHSNAPVPQRSLIMEGFAPLSCNSVFSACQPFTTVFGSSDMYTNRMTIPCGSCITMDHPGPTVTFVDGLDIRGKLIFPDNYNLKVVSSLIVVQGALEMTASKPVDGSPQIIFYLTGTGQKTFTPAANNAGFCGVGDCIAGIRSIVVAGGRLNSKFLAVARPARISVPTHIPVLFLFCEVHGLPANTPTWLPLFDVDGDSAIIVSNSVQGKWGVGSDIVITSNTQSWTADQPRTITSVSSASSGFVRLGLNAAIARPNTISDNVGFAVEVALLSRNILFDSESGGGHFMIMETPGVQTIEGIEVKNFGQQGTLGKYPIHFHLCGDVAGAVLAKNTVRLSNQRCIVVHGTDNLIIEDNVAYDTKGHCFILEDGIETGNQFLHNIGIKTGIPATIIPDMGPNGKETDGSPSTFWITNPHNTWYVYC